MIKYLKLPFTFDVSGIDDELQILLEKHWQMHFNKRDYAGEWTVLPLISYEGKNTIFPKQYGNMETPHYKPTEFLEQSPMMQQILAFFQFPIISARLMNLKAGAIIKEHSDLELSYEDGTVRLHIPIMTNEQVHFFLENEEIPMQTGECWYLNLSLKHKVLNEGKSDRIHLVIDGTVNEWVKDCFSDPSISIKKVSEKTNSDIDISTKRKMIEHLQLQGTETSLLIAKRLEQEINAV